MEPTRELIYVFRKRYGGKIEVTQISFQDYLDLKPETTLINTGKWAEIKLLEFIDNVMKKGSGITVSRNQNLDAYNACKRLYEKPPDFDKWDYNNAMKLYRYIVIAREDKNINPIWYIPKEDRYKITV